MYVQYVHITSLYSLYNIYKFPPLHLPVLQYVPLPVSERMDAHVILVSQSVTVLPAHLTPCIRVV